MKTFFIVMFVISSFILMMSEAMALASTMGLWVWIGIALLILSMVVVGCWSLPDETTNRLGWVSVLIAGLFCLVTSVIGVDGFALWKVALSLAYLAVAVFGVLRPTLFEDSSAQH